MKVEDEVEHEGEKGIVKQVLCQVEVNKILIFAEIKKGPGKYENDVLVIMSKDRTCIGYEWFRDDYGERFK